MFKKLKADIIKRLDQKLWLDFNAAREEIRALKKSSVESDIAHRHEINSLVQRIGMLNDNIAELKSVVGILLVRLNWSQAGILAFGRLSPEIQRRVLEHPELLEVETRNRGAVEEYMKEQKELEELSDTLSRITHI
jgi:hypothetical protein